MDPIHHVLESIGIHAAFQCAFGAQQLTQDENNGSQGSARHDKMRL
jgi:hypothetical protein